LQYRNTKIQVKGNFGFSNKFIRIWQSACLSL
jgi:hypothetical protein